jgi:hypothetical protein
VVERDASVLSGRARLRVEAVVVLGAAVVTWFVVAPHLGRVGLWPSIVIVSFGVLPATLGLVLLALPLAAVSWRVLLVSAILLALVALAFSEGGVGLGANFAKLWAAIFTGWAFLRLFEELSWVVLVAVIIPVVDAISVWRGPTHQITAHHFNVYTDVAVAFVAPGGGAADLGPPDILFYGLFLGAAARFRLRPFWTWVGMTGMYSFTIVLTNLISVSGLPALPFLSFGFLVANADLLWRRLRQPRPRDAQTDA